MPRLVRLFGFGVVAHQRLERNPLVPGLVGRARMPRLPRTLWRRLLGSVERLVGRIRCCRHSSAARITLEELRWTGIPEANVEVLSHLPEGEASTAD